VDYPGLFLMVNSKADHHEGDEGHDEESQSQRFGFGSPFMFFMSFMVEKN